MKNFYMNSYDKIVTSDSLIELLKKEIVFLPELISYEYPLDATITLDDLQKIKIDMFAPLNLNYRNEVFNTGSLNKEPKHTIECDAFLSKKDNNSNIIFNYVYYLDENSIVLKQYELCSTVTIEELPDLIVHMNTFLYQLINAA